MPCLLNCVPKTNRFLEVGASHQPDSLQRDESTLHHSSVQSSVDFTVQGYVMKGTQEAVPPTKCLPSVQDSKRPCRLSGKEKTS